MAVLIAAHDVAVGALLVLTAGRQRRRHPECARSVASRLTRWVDISVNGAFNLITSPIAGYKRRDRILATHAAGLDPMPLTTWLPQLRRRDDVVAAIMPFGFPLTGHTSNTSP